MKKRLTIFISQEAFDKLVEESVRFQNNFMISIPPQKIVASMVECKYAQNNDNA